MSNPLNPSQPENSDNGHVPSSDQAASPQQPVTDYTSPTTEPQYQQPPQGYQAPAGGPINPTGFPPSATGGPVPVGYAQKSKLTVGLLGIFLGGLGIHNFYVGRPTIGAIQLALTILSLGFLAAISGIWGLVEGILYLTSNEPRWSTDGRGVPLI